MIISDEVFYAFLTCRMKAYQLLFSDPTLRRPVHSLSECQRQIQEKYRKEYVKILTLDTPDTCFNVTITTSNVQSRDFKWFVGPEIFTPDLASHVPLLENTFYSKEPNRFGPIPVRLFSSEKVIKDQRLLLAFDALTLGKATGYYPKAGKIVHGRQRNVARVNVNRLVPEVESIVEEIRLMSKSDHSPSLILSRHCQECAFESLCREKALEEDNITLLGMLPPKEIGKLKRKGITTITQLSYTFRPRRRRRRSGVGKTGPYDYALKALAVREKTTYIVGRPELSVNGTAVYLDVEGIPERKFYYLIGVRAVLHNLVAEQSFWANDENEEEIIWREFINFLSSIDKPVILHYGNFENIFLERMNHLYGTPLDSNSSFPHLGTR